jgi:hypothetical protein
MRLGYAAYGSLSEVDQRDQPMGGAVFFRLDRSAGVGEWTWDGGGGVLASRDVGTW